MQVMTRREVDRRIEAMEDGERLGLSGVRCQTMTRTQTAQYLGVRESWLRNNATSPLAPPFVKIGGQVRYVIADVDSWLAQQRVTAA